ncbi:MAG: aldo/keto reductase [Roseivirga sp.]|uniref:aldo/keto reductase n=1 Tax=Roseivirga sp. TaxID=1964215 RepID=UPI001B09D048|nr:aldo/keto reductase [Roseivirga sp.]MBO6660443.1 aldo/keto reductase [Roseivirga sp.]MBO6761165.1 aldo/keto reductase [Roseivirga sp.]MBO6906820.1 aldo/keto reductase [Roseivirga sp.]
MNLRKLGNTDIEVSPIAFGAFAIGGTMWAGNEGKDSINAIHAAIDNGISTLDTAPFYGLGRSEELIGKAIADKRREDIQILNKFGLVWDGSNNGKGDYFFDTEDNGKNYSIYKFASKENVVKEVEESLKRLGTDYIDLLQLHWPDSTTPISETMEAMERLLEQGKIRAAGVCNYSVDQLKEAGETLKLSSNQVSYSMLQRGIEADLVPFAQSNDLSMIAYSPMERGLLTGKYFKDGKLEEADHRNGYFKQFDLERIEKVLNELLVIADSYNASLAQLVLNWTMNQPGITVTLAGARNDKQVASNAAAMNLSISDADMASINQHLESLK